MANYRPVIMCGLTSVQSDAILRAIKVLSDTDTEDDLVHVGPLHILWKEYQDNYQSYARQSR